VIIYLIGELKGRLGYPQEATKWLGRLLQTRNLEPYLKRLLQERWEIYRQQIYRDN